MRFEFEQADDTDFHGDFVITAETEIEVKDLIDHFRLFDGDIRAQVKALDAGTLTKRCTTYKSFGSEYRWFEINGALDWDFSAPYLKLLENCTGLDVGGVLPDMELLGPTLIHTFYPKRIWLEQGHICFQCYDSATEWNKLDAPTYCEKMVIDHVQEMFGHRHHEREYIESPNGQYRLNPDYLKRHSPKPSASNENLKAKLFSWWMDNHANDAQRAVIASSVECHKQNRTSFKGFDEYIIHYDNWTKMHNWETLRALA